MKNKKLDNMPFENDISTTDFPEILSSEAIANELEDELMKKSETDALSEPLLSDRESGDELFTEAQTHNSENVPAATEKAVEGSVDNPENTAIPFSDAEQSANTDIPSESDIQDTEDKGSALNYDIFGNLENTDNAHNVSGEAAIETVFVAEEPEDTDDIPKDESQETFEAVFPEAFPEAFPDEEESDDADGIPEEEEYEADDSTSEEEVRHPIHGLFDFLELFVFSFVAVLVFTTFFFRHSVVEGDSMVDTLHEGEHLIISDLFYTPERGDIIVCEDYSTTLRKPIVKRIIATEGDYVQILITGEVFINGELIEENYVFIDGPLPITPVDTVVPEGEVFVMGDHRNMSTDSRMFGTIDEDSIIGKVLLRFYPFDTFGRVE